MPTPTPKRRETRQESAPALPQVKTSILARMERQSLILTGMPILLLGVMAFLIAQSLLSNRILVQVAGMATFREDYLEETLRQARERTALIASRLTVTTDRPALEKLFQELRRQNTSVLGITLLSPGRTITASVGEQSDPLLSDFSTSSIVLPIIDRKAGWQRTDVYVPFAEGDERSGFVAIRYDSAPILASLFSQDSLGGGRVVLGVERGGELFVLHHSVPDQLHSYDVGSIDNVYLRDLPLTQAVQGDEGVMEGLNEHGQRVFAAYRFVPSLGWGMVVEIDAATALSGVTTLGISVVAIGAILLVLSAFLGYTSAGRLAHPLVQLSQRMAALKPGKWDLQRSVHTGDEVEVLDQVAVDLATRLRTTYDHLEEKVAERTEQLRKASALDRAILENIEYGVIAVDIKGAITAANPAAVRLLQWNDIPYVGKIAAELVPYIERKAQYNVKNHPVSQTLLNHSVFRSHSHQHPNLITSKQSLMPVTLAVAPLMEGKRLLGAIMVFQDMTEERQIDYMKSEFITLASHQLRTPLSSIRWYVELIGTDEKKEMTPTQRTYFNEIEKASGRMANLLEALLHVARLENGVIVPEPQNVDLVELIAQMAEEWKLMARERNIKLELFVPGSAKLRTDPILLQIVLQNFLTNSFKYSPRGKEVQLRIRHERDHMIISVQDQGIGIPLGEQKRMFEKFFRAHNVRTMDTDGSGLGLYIGKAIADKLGASIFFESQEGKGSTFTLVLPAEKKGTPDSGPKTGKK